jgi:outer membrane protein assembly factor BamA
MKAFVFLALILAPLAGCGVPDDDERNLQELNVNSRYTVESVHLLSVHTVKISDALRRELDRIVGSKFDDSALKRLADRIQSEVRATEVRIKAVRGTEPDRLIVNFEVNTHEQRFDLNVAKFLYNSKEGWSGSGGLTTNFKGNAVSFGLLSDADSLLERFSGIRARFERKNVIANRVHLRFDFESFHEMWNSATLAAASPGDIYRNRQTFMPEATVVILQPLELDLGASFARFQPITAGSAAKTESSNAVVSTLRYHQRWGSEHDQKEQEVNGSYSLRSASGLFGTDQVFTRQMASARYRFRRGHNTVELGFLAGRITGHAPLFERFVVGDSTTLRGWSKFDLDPLGGSRVIHGSVDYRYRAFQAFYDTGAIWDDGRNREQKQSVGTGFKVEGFQLAVAFPLRAGRADPIFYAGLNF